jgi:hypothetical protein
LTDWSVEHVRNVGERRTGVIEDSTRPPHVGALRALIPCVLAGALRRSEDFDAAENALLEAIAEDG